MRQPNCSYWCTLYRAGALALSAVLLPGCSHANRTSEREPVLAAQIEAVRHGDSKWLRLDQTMVRDEDLTALAGIEDRVERVNFSRTELTDAGLAALCRLSNLEQLRVASPRITDAGMDHISNLKKLRFLHLLDAPITDAGLEPLHGLTTLESVYLDRTQVTDDGIGRLLEALPNVHLHLDDHHHPLDRHGSEHQHEPAE